MLVLIRRLPVAALLLCATACAAKVPPPIPPEPTVTVPSGQPFTLSPGQTAIISDTGISLTFVRVVDDTRCPVAQDVACVWSGDATVVIRSSGATYELHTDWGAKAATLAPHLVTLQALAPGRKFANSIDQQDYSATLQVS
ncbi:hypothetical protein [Nocardia sp. NPDC051832]|uniref:hypothetical protein n=1 Tax=Nocardia sp. NPDC051832 TaxID=3155673 RepID=UPI00341DC31D